MAQETVAPVGNVEAKSEDVRISFTIPADQYKRLVEDVRFTLKMDKTPFYRHVFNEFDKAHQTSSK